MSSGVLAKVVGVSMLVGASSVLAVQATIRWLRGSRDAPCQCQIASYKKGTLVHAALLRSDIRPGDLLVLMDHLKETDEILQGCKYLEVNFLVLHSTAALDEEWLQSQASVAKVFVYSKLSKNAARFNQLLEARAFSNPADACLQLSTDSGMLSSRDNYQAWLHYHTGQDVSNSESVKASGTLTWSEKNHSVSSSRGEHVTLMPALAHKEEAAAVKRAERPPQLRAAPPPPAPAAAEAPATGELWAARSASTPVGSASAPYSSLGLMVAAREKEQGGVRVTRILAGEWAEREGSIRAGDALLSVNGSAITSPDQFSALLQRYDGATLIFALHRPHAEHQKPPLLLEVVLSSDTRPGSSLPLFFTQDPIQEKGDEGRNIGNGLRFVL